MAEANGAKKAGAPTGENVPREGLDVAESLARKLWDAARGGTIKRAAFAVNIGHANVKSGGFRAKLALLAYFKLAETPGDGIKLSPIGLRIVRDDNEQVRAAARREAFLGQKHFGAAIRTFAGQKLPAQATLASNFKYEWRLGDDASAKVADAFITSAKFAGLVDDSDTVVLEASEMQAADETPGEDGNARVGVTGTQQDPPPPPPPPPAPPVETLSLVRGNATLEVKLDLSAFAVDDVLRLLTALGFVQQDDDGDASD